MEDRSDYIYELESANRLVFARIIQVKAYFDRVQSQRTGQKTFIDLQAESEIDKVIENTRRLLEFGKKADYAK